MEKYPILEKKLKNGITEYIYPVEGLENDNFLALTVKVGSAAEKEYNAGIAHFVEHVQMSFFDEEEKDYLCSAYTDFYSTTFYFDTKSRGIGKIINLMQKIIAGKFLIDFDIEKIRKEVLEEYENAICKRFQADFYFLLENTEYARHYSIGSRQCIHNFSKNDIWKFYETYYLLGNMSITWIGSAEDIMGVGTKWIENLSGIPGKTKLRILNYTFPARKIETQKQKEKGRTAYYFFRKRSQETDTLDEALLFTLEEILNQYVGKIQVEKLYLSCRQEFLRIISMEGKTWKEMYEVIKKISLIEWASKYKLFLKKELIGYNCNSLREQLVNSFIYNVRVTEKKADIKKEVATLLNVLKTGPVAISKG